MTARMALFLFVALGAAAGCTAENPADAPDAGQSDSGAGPGDAASTDGAQTACADLKQQVQRVLDDHQACKVDTDCVIAQTACGLPGACDTDGIYANKEWRTAELERLLMEWLNAMCGPKMCPCPRGPVREPACNRGVCGPRGSGNGAVGAPCTAGTECATGQCQTEAEDKRFVGGYCTLKICDRIDMACPAGSTCEPIGGATHICLANCDAMNTCRRGYGCCGPGPRLKGWCSPTDSPLCMLR